EREQRSRKRSRSDDVFAPRSRARVQLRLPAASHTAVEAAIRALSPALSRELSSGVVFERLCALLARVVCAEASRRRLRGDVRRVDDAALGMAQEIPRLGSDREAAVYGPDRKRTGQC